MSNRRYPDFLYRDPLLQPQYLTNTRAGTPIVQTNVIDINVEGDDLLHAYIRFLDEEIFSEIPENMNSMAEAWWMSDDWSSLCITLFNEARKHGWAVVQFYEEEDTRGRWKVFSVPEFTDYIKETATVDDVEKIVAVGMKFEWGDYLGNNWKEELRFDDPYTHLVKFREGDGHQVFAFPDLSQAIMSLAFQIRQVKGQLTYSAAKPSYQHFVYGTAADDDNIDDLDAKIKFIDTSSAIGAPKAVLDEIVTIKNENLEIIEPALEKLLQYFAGATRLPLSFYIGQRNRSGFGITDVGEKTDMVAVINKKNNIFKRFLPYLQTMFSDIYGIDLGDLELAQDIAMDEIEEENSDQESTGFQNKTVEN